MFRKLASIGLLATAWTTASEVPEWTPIDEPSISVARARLAQHSDTPPSVSAVSIFSHGPQSGRQNRLSFSVVNTSGNDAQVLVEFIDETGRALTLPTTKGSAAAVSLRLTSGAQLTESLPESAALSRGWIRITTDSAAGVYGQAKWSISDSVLQLPATSAAKLRSVIQVDDRNTFLAFVNPSAEETSTIRLSAFDGGGTESCSTQLDLPFNAQLQSELTTWLPCAQAAGQSVRIETTQGQAVLAAYGYRDDKFTGLIPVHEEAETKLDSPQLMAVCNPYFSDDTSPIFSAAGGHAFIYVRAAAGCRWSISGATGGITVSKLSGTGGARIQVTAGNWNAAGGRQAFLQVGSSRYRVRQQGVRCNFSLNSGLLEFGSGGGSKAFFVQSNCFWEVKESSYWISVNEKFGFQNMGAVVSVTPSNRSRGASILVGDKRLSVQQAPNLR